MMPCFGGHIPWKPLRNHTCDFSRDSGWQIMEAFRLRTSKNGFNRRRLECIKFRKTENIKKK